MSQTTPIPASLVADLKSTTAAFAEFGALQARADQQLYKALAVVAKVVSNHKRKEFVAAVAGKFTVRDDTPSESIVLKLSYGWDTKSKVAQVSAWSKVLKEAKKESVEPSDLVDWIAKCGGIEAIRNGWHKDAEASDSSENNDSGAAGETASKSEIEVSLSEEPTTNSLSEKVADVSSQAMPANASASESAAASAPIKSTIQANEDVADANEGKVLAAVAEFAGSSISEPAGQQLPPRTRAFQLLDGPYRTTATIPQSSLKLEADATNGVAIPLLKRNESGDWDVIAVWTGGPIHTNSITGLGDYLNKMSSGENGMANFFTLYAEEKEDTRQTIADTVDAVRSENEAAQPAQGKFRSFIISGVTTIDADRTEEPVKSE